MRYNIRPAILADAALLPAIERSAGELFRQSPNLAWVADGDVQSEEQHVEFIEKGMAWVAVTSKDVPVGFLNGKAVDGQFHIYEVSVHGAHQRHGLGSALVNRAKLFAQDHGYPAVTLTTFRDVEWNDGFYRRVGFRMIEGFQLSNALAEILADEIEVGLPGEARCAMVIELGSRAL
jgi:ribosomal protein S18 acetylase RimI-like enzyme